MNIRTVFLAGALALFGATSVQAQGGQELFQQALVQEQAEGDLRAAIKLYTRIVTDYVLDRPLVARALMRIGAAYDKLGDAAARTAYERIVAEYADQHEALRVARERLRVLDPEGAGAAVEPRWDPTFTLLADMAQRPGRSNWVDYSPDGTRFVTVRALRSGPDKSRGALFVSDRSGAGLRPLSEPVDEAGQPTWSPDGTLIAFHHHDHPENGKTGSNVERIFVVSQDGSDPRQVGPDLGSFDDGDGREGGYAGPIWTPSGNISFLAVEDGVIVTVDPAGNTIREVSLVSNGNDGDGLGGVAPWVYSPDGRWLALYSAGGPGESRLGSFWVMRATGGPAHRIVGTRFSGAAFDWPGIGFAWSEDGNTVFFAGLRGEGSDDIHKLAFDPRSGEVSGAPELVSSFPGSQVSGLKMLPGRGMTYQLTTENNLIVVGSTSNPQEVRTVARGTAGQISPDGQTVYYVGEGYGRDGIFAIPTEGGTPRLVSSTMPAHSGFRLSPDGSEISYHTHSGGETSLSVLEIQGGEARLLAQVGGETTADAVWSPDGSKLAFAAGENLFVVMAQGGEPEIVARTTRWEGGSIRWSPDGKYLAGFGYVEGEEADVILVVESSGGQLRRLTRPEETFNKEGLAWHPDSQRLSYMNYDPDGSRMAYLDGRPTTLLARVNGGWDYVGGWTPSGDTYLFYNSGSGGHAVYAYDEASGRTTEFYERGLGFMHLGERLGWTWSRDGRTFTARKRGFTVQNWLIEGSR